MCLEYFFLVGYFFYSVPLVSPVNHQGDSEL